MEIVSLSGTQDIASGDEQYGMVVVVRGEAYNIPINFEGYQLLNELATLSKQQVPPPEWQEPAVFESPDPAPRVGQSEVDQLAKVGLFQPQNVLEAMSAGPDPVPDEQDLMGTLEDTDDDDGDDPGELVAQYPGE